MPAPLPPVPPLLIDSGTAVILSEASRNIGILDGIAGQIPDIGLFVAMYVHKEALLSSQIEGTQATLDDILDPAVGKNTNQDVAEVLNYIKALQAAILKLSELPLCCRLIKEAHLILMKDSRGGEKNPGEFRQSQNWIGPAGSLLKDARYIPPNISDMQDSMSCLEKYINNEDDNDPLIKIALIHYQFETIHPFLDGNGRIGRLLVILYLLEKKIIRYPVLYISHFLKKNRIEYYDRLTEVRTKGNYEQWINFFLLALNESAKDAADTIHELTKLHDNDVIKVNAAFSGKQLQTTLKILDHLGKSPIADIGRTAGVLGLSYNTVANIFNILKELGILKQTTNALRNRIFIYDKYMEILRRGT